MCYSVITAFVYNLSGRARSIAILSGITVITYSLFSSCHRTINYRASFLGLKEPLLKIISLRNPLNSNSSPISKSRRFEIGHLFRAIIIYNINSLLRLRIGMHIEYRA